MNNFVSCIVAAGGSGSRMKANKNKLFLDINGMPVIAHTLTALNKSRYISEIIISSREEDAKLIEECVNKYCITKAKSIVKGGATRAESVFSAISEISDVCDYVMIHDGARPFVTDVIIAETIEKAKEYSAAACGVKPKCTLKTVNSNGVIIDTVDREKTIEIQTPQVFDKTLLKKMYSLGLETIKSATDDCVLAEKCGADIYVTEGSYKNIKITTPEDIEIAEIFAKGIQNGY